VESEQSDTYLLRPLGRQAMRNALDRICWLWKIIPAGERDAEGGMTVSNL
jgi:hypothetical protein